MNRTVTHISSPATRNGWSMWQVLGTVVIQIALAAVTAVRPGMLLIFVGVVVVLGLVAWAFTGEPLLRTAQESAVQGASATPGTTERLAPMPALWTATLVTFGLLVLDIQGLFTHGDVGGVSPLRYLLLPVPVAIVFLSARQTSLRPAIGPGDVFITTLLAWGLSASLVYKVGTAGAISGLSMFLPMLLVLLPFFPRGGEVSEASARRMLDLFTYVGLAYVLVHLSAGLGVPGVARGAHGHQQGFMLAAAVAAAYITGRRKLALLELGAVSAIYLLYPAATYITTAGAVILTIMLVSAKRSRFRTVAIMVTVATLLLLGFSSSLSSNEGSFANALLPRYFNAIGKSDNSEFRREMLKLGVEQVKASPVLGAKFTGGFALPTKFRAGNQVVLPHNDYLELALAGGLVALSLFLGWAGWVNITAIRRHRILTNAGAHGQATVLWTMLIGFNACLSVALFQPVLFEVGTVTFFFMMYCCMRVACVGDAPTAGANGGREREMPVST